MTVPTLPIRPSLLCMALAALWGLPTPAAPQDAPDEDAFLSGLHYRMVGPHRGGRVTAVTGVAGDPFTFYFGSTGGGVWKTDDAGESWRPLTDGQLAAGGIGALAVAPSDPNVIYAGTGSACTRGNVSPGIGIYGSTDAGKTWRSLGLDAVGQIGRVRVDPTDPDRVFVAALGNAFGPNPERGVFRSVDGGATWDNVLHISDSTGVVDLAIDPSNPRILFAAAWRGERKPWTMISGAEEGGLYRSKDGGDTWQKLSGGLPGGVIGKIGVAVSPANPNRVWALIEHDEGGLYRSDDGGDRWRRVSAEKGLYHRPWYYMHVTGDPTDENTVWINNVLLYKSLDGGANFTVVPTPHPDSHQIWINPENPRIMIEGNDGGANVTVNGGRTWSTQRNQPTAELYRVTVDHQFPYRLYGAQQDNSTISVPSRVSPFMVSDFEHEHQVGGCESGHVAVDPRNPDIVYAGCFGGSITRTDVSTGQQREILTYPELQLAQRPGELRYRFQWNAPIRVSPHDPDIVYHTSQVVHRTRDGGQSWEVISPDLSTNDPAHQDFAGGPITQDGTGVEVYGTIFVFEESPHEAGVLWAGTDDGRIHVSRDAGGSWDDVTPDDLPTGATVNSIDISAHDPERVHVAAFRYREADFQPLVFRTDDGGRSWQRLTDGSNGIPATHFTRVVREDPERRGLLYAGTEFGMYVSLDDGATWSSLQRNLPVTPVTDLQVHEGDLVLSTQGRSFWILDDVTPLRERSQAMQSPSVHLHTPRPAYRVPSGGLQLGANRRAQNPPAGAILYYAVAEDLDLEAEGPLDIVILDAQGDTAKRFSSDPLPAPDLGPMAALASLFGFGGGPPPLAATRGLHRINWDLRYPPPSPPPGTVVFGTVPSPTAPPGTYTVRMTLGEQALEAPLEVRADPRGSVPATAFADQFALLRSLGEALEQLKDRTESLRSVREQANDVDGLLEDAGVPPADRERAAALGDTLREALTDVEEQVLQTRSTSFYDPLGHPGQLAAQIIYLYGVVAGNFGGSVDAPPTDGARERARELEAEVARILGRLQEIYDTDLAEFNALLRSLDLDPIVVAREVRVIS